MTIFADPGKEADMAASAKITKEIHNGYSDFFVRDASKVQLQVKECVQPYQQPTIVRLGVDETLDMCNTFILLPKPNGSVYLCLDPARPNQAFITPMHGGPTINDIFPRLTNAQYITLIDARSGYSNMKPDKKSPYLRTYACQFTRYRYVRLLSKRLQY